MTFTAVFEQNVHIRLVNGYSTWGKVKYNEYQDYNTMAQLVAVPLDSYKFDKWVYNGEEYYDDTLNIQLTDQDIKVEVFFTTTNVNFRLYENYNTGNSYLVSNITSPSCTWCYVETNYNYNIDDVLTISPVMYNGMPDEWFVGWYDKKGNLLSTDLNYSFTLAPINSQIHAKWKSTTVNCGYDAAKGAINHANLEFKPYSEAWLKALPNDGYTFAGWFKDSDYNELISTDSNYFFSTGEPGSVETVYALFI